MKILSLVTAILLISLTATSQDPSVNILSENQNNEPIAMTVSQFDQLNIDQLDGVYNLVLEEGSLQEVRSYRKGKLDGTWKQYSKNHQLLAIANYTDDMKDGLWEIWDESGTKRYEMYYNMGKRTGTWKAWDEDGKLISEKKY